MNLLILSLPLGGIAALRLYENELIRGTEAQLMVQGAVIREAFRVEVLRQLAAARDSRSPKSGADPQASGSGTDLEPGTPIVFPRPGPPLSDPPFDAVLPRLDISKQALLPPAPDAAPAQIAPDPIASLAGAQIEPVLQASMLATLAGVRITDQSGIVVATTRSEKGLSLAHREEVARALRGEEVSLLRQRTSEAPSPPLESISRGQRYRVFVALPVIEKNRVIGAVVLSRTPLDIAKALYLIWPTLLFGAGALFGVVVVVAVLTSFTINRPLSALTRQAERVARGERGAAIEETASGTREVAQLSAALARMARTLEERAEYIRTFASHVSHEFKTPLTTIRGTVELLEDHFATMSPAERMRFLNNLSDASNRLDRLVHRLLDLARADVVQPGEGATAVCGELDRLIGRYREDGLDVSVQHGEGVGFVLMAEDAFEEVISNLLDNARQHGGGGVTVNVSSRMIDGSVEVMVSDTGPGISDANAFRIFTPFFTTARGTGGSGLGLSIVRSLLEAHGGTVELAHAGRGATFVIHLPAGPRSTGF